MKRTTVDLTDEDMAALELGRFMRAFGRLEINVAYRLVDHMADRTRREMVNKMTFLKKLDELSRLVAGRSDIDHDWKKDHIVWTGRAKCLLKLRNQYAHGRWGYKPMDRKLAFVSPGLPLEPEFAPEQRLMTVDDLRADRDSLDQLNRELFEIEDRASQRCSPQDRRKA